MHIAVCALKLNVSEVHASQRAQGLYWVLMEADMHEHRRRDHRMVTLEFHRKDCIRMKIDRQVAHVAQ